MSPPGGGREGRVLAVTSAAAFVTPFGLLYGWLTSRPVKFTKGERAVLIQAAVFVRLAAPQYSNHDRERNAEALERMASR